MPEILSPSPGSGLVAAGLAFAGYQDARRAREGALARAVSEGVQNAGDGSISEQNSDQDHRNGSKGDSESNQ